MIGLDRLLRGGDEGGAVADEHAVAVARECHRGRRLARAVWHGQGQALARGERGSGSHLAQNSVCLVASKAA